MATTLGLSLQISANTNGLGQGLEKADKALLSFGRQMNVVGKQASKFSDDMGQLPQAFGDIEAELDLLAQRFKAGAIEQEYFTERFKALKQAAKDNVAAFKEGAKLNEKYKSSTEKAAEEQARLTSLFEKGAISSKTFNTAMKEQAEIISRVEAEQNGSAEALRQFTANEERAAQITQSLATSEERLAAEQAELDNLLNKGVLSQEAYARGTEKISNQMNKLGPQAKQTGVQFNELSGIFGLLPGPLGAFASRVSSFSSALSGLGKLFSGGIGNLSGLASSFMSMVNPVTIAAAGIIGFGAAIAGVAKGLISLEKNVEDISRSARLLGTDFEFLQALKTSSDRAGRSFSELQEPIARFLSTTQKIKEGDKKLAESFAKVGISIEDVESKNPDDLLKQLTKNLAEIEDPAKRAAAEIAIFGEQGPKIRDSLGGFADAADDIDRFNASLSDTEIDNITAFGLAADGLATAFEGAFQNIIAPFANIGKSISRGLSTAIAGIGNLAGVILDVLSPVFTGLGIIIEGVFNYIGTVANYLSAVFEPLAAIGRTMNEVWSKVGDVFADLNAYVNGLINDFREFFSSIFDGSEGVTAAFGKIVEFGERLINIGAALAQKFGKYMADLYKSVVDFVKSSPLLNAAAETISGAFILLGEGLSNIGKVITDTLGTLGKYVEYWLKFAESWLGITNGPKLADVVGDIDVAPELDTVNVGEFQSDLDSAIDSVADLGQAGFDAALRYQEQLEEIVALQEEGELTQEEAQRAVENTTKEFERQKSIIEDQNAAIEEQKKLEEDLLKADQDIVASLLEQQRIESEFGGSSERFEASKNVLAINREIARVEEEIAAARSSGDTEALEAGNKRLSQLDQIKAQEEDVASGRKDAMEETLKLEKDLAKEQEKLDEMLKSGGPSKERLSAIDASSAAGIEETLRLERGDDPAAEAAEKQLSKLDEIKKAIVDAKVQEVLIPS